MTTYNHTAIPASSAANTAVLNAPLAQLDAAMGNVATLTLDGASIVSGIGTAAPTTTAQTVIGAINEAHGEITTARNGYTTLDERLDALVLVGGNIATLTSGASNAGQKRVDVDSTTGFIAGAYVAYTLAGGAIEYNTIDTVTTSTRLDMKTNVGTGGIADDTYISMISPSEVAAANAINHTGDLTLEQAMGYAAGQVFNVKAYGALGDSITGDGAKIQAAINAAAAYGTSSNRGHVYIPGGFYNCTDATVIAPVGMTIYGDGAQSTILYRSTPGTILQIAPTTGDYTGVPVNISGIKFINEGTGTPGSCIEVVNAKELMIDTVITRCWFQGVTGGVSLVTGIKAIAQQTTISDCIFDMLLNGIWIYSTGAAYQGQNVNISNAMMTTLADVGVRLAGITSYPVRNINISNMVMAVNAVTGPHPAAIKADYADGVQVNNLQVYSVDKSSFLVSGVYFSQCNRVNINGLHVTDSVGTDTDYGAVIYLAGCAEVNITNFHTLNASSYRPAYGIMADTVLRLFVSGFSISGTLRYGIYEKTSFTGAFRDGYIVYTGQTTPATYAAMKVVSSRTLVDNVIFSKASASYSTYAFDVSAATTAGDVFIAENNQYDGGILPVDETTVTTTATGKMRIEEYQPFLAFTADDATPTVAYGNRFKTANVNPTTVTMFDGGKNGQQITVIIADAVTSFDFTSTNLVGNGGGDWSPVAGDWLEAFFDGTKWYCSVHDCTAP